MDALEPHRRYLRALLYRMTGSASDAEDLVQETFLRATERPPPDVDRELRPWLVRVAVNLARDHLRRRRRRGYPGTWLPEPLASAEDARTSSEPDPEARYAAAESLSFAFLLALEPLTPLQRAVLVLRDVFGHSSSEAAAALGVSEGNVRVTLLRARRALAAYDASPRHANPAARDRATEALAALVAALSAGDTRAAAALFAPGARALSDGGGVHAAARHGVEGAEKIALMYAKLARNASPGARAELRELNGTAAFTIDDPGARRPNAPRAALLVEIDAEGRITRLYSVLAPAKLRRIAWA